MRRSMPVRNTATLTARCFTCSRATATTCTTAATCSGKPATSCWSRTAACTSTSTTTRKNPASSWCSRPSRCSCSCTCCSRRWWSGRPTSCRPASRNSIRRRKFEAREGTMTLFEDKQAALSGDNTSEFLAEAMVESEKFRTDYATLPNVIKAKDMPWERSPDGLIKHLVNQKMHTRECCIEAYMQFLKDGERSGKHRHMWEELFFVVEGSGYDLHWDLKWDCLEAFDWQWAEAPKKFEWTVGDYVYIPPFTMHQHFANAGQECRIIVMSNRIVKDMGFDWYDQVERAPGF